MSKGLHLSSGIIFRERDVYYLHPISPYTNDFYANVKMTQNTILSKKSVRRKEDLLEVLNQNLSQNIILIKLK